MHSFIDTFYIFRGHFLKAAMEFTNSISRLRPESVQAEGSGNLSTCKQPRNNVLKGKCIDFASRETLAQNILALQP